MTLSYGELLYGYAHLGLEIDETAFKDTDTRDFIVAMKSNPIESMTGITRWGEISVTPISKDSFIREYNHMVYTPMVNQKAELLKMSLLLNDWGYLSTEFPELAGQTYKVNNTKNPLDIELDEDTFYPFFDQWDKGYRGLRDDDFIVFFAPPKHAKSTITAYLAYEAIKSGIPIGFYPTELSVSVTLKYIFGFEYGLRGNEALMFFDGYIDSTGHPVPGNKAKLRECMEKYNHLVYLPPSNIFTWNDYEALYESDAKFIFHDNFVRTLSQLGLNEDATSASQLSRKLATIQQKHRKCTFLVTQEAMREASTKELETNPTKLEIGKGYTALSRSLLQECSLALNVRERANSQVKELIIKNDRFRGLSDVNTQIFGEIDNRGKLIVTKVSDSIEKVLGRIEKKMLSEEFESKSATKEERTEYFTGLAQHINGDDGGLD